MFLQDLEDEQDDLENEGLKEETESEEDEEYLEEEETLEELDVDDRGHVRPRRSRRDEFDEELEY